MAGCYSMILTNFQKRFWISRANAISLCQEISLTYSRCRMKGFWPRYPRCSIDVINTKCRPRTMTTSWLDADRVGGVIFSMPNQVGSPPIHAHADLPHYPQSNLRWSRDDKWMPKSQVIL